MSTSVPIDDPLSKAPGEWQQWMTDRGYPAFRGRQLFEWLWRHHIRHYDDITVWPKDLRRTMATAMPLNRLELVKAEAAEDGTTKLLLELADRQRVETVILPHDYGHSLCISSQVGCAMGCHFCASGLKGRIRQLSAGEMLDQVAYANRWLKPQGAQVTRIDIMGIGEPLDNYPNVIRFLHLVHDPLAMGLGYRHITVSTSGVVPKIYQLADEGLPVTLAVSLHAPTDALRSQLMPVNRAYPIRKLMDACRYYVERTGRRITFEYLLLRGINDHDELAVKLAELVRGFPSHVNLIPWNPVDEHPFLPSPSAQVRRFQHIVQDAGISCTIRRELGQEIDAACGQLRLREEEPVSP
ncbi:radical SAM enzyme, Cfr family [Sulfobacillus acidophilus TPY]|uniref:Probable dual-specificity RNA methyltransferase RlmN n=1 Tax=Sulfobacillus acidophilus (strain ATCC 700253 / DSM 10332 / NAL) TaxID=679936 RepID=G8TW47_SULAD|nr:radical SAM enzyme, Cfr family [Sulfobacillus acidophilus TPY]AEW05974.1 23S rRNA m(2)A-2503 methyltransferase [Sulfobacillus acidophilus DSM 10332]